LLVGPGMTYTTIRAAASAAANGDVVVIAAGDYVGDVTTWPQDGLTICGSGGRARLFANGQNAAGKGIWVVQGSNVVIENMEFHDATVPDQNGAGIRAEGNGLTIRGSGFYDNEDGILGPDGGDLTIENSEFARNGYGDGQSHNIYVGAANRLTVISSYFHEAKIGHNLKSRAKETHIENSFFMDGPSGTASYQIDVPNGGLVYLRGNQIQKGPNADNSNVIAYGAEGVGRWPANTLTMVHNTVTSTYPGGSLLNINASVQAVTLTANLFAGTNGPSKISGGVAASKITETATVVSTASNFNGIDNVAAPNFWPSAPLAASLALGAVIPDPRYLEDSPRPYTLRPIGAAAPRMVGALQAAP
jgi:hypothetical protein